MTIKYDELMVLARKQAKIHHHKYIRTEHLLLALLMMDTGQELVPLQSVVPCLKNAIAVMRCPTCDAEEKMELSASAKRAYQLAQTDSQDVTAVTLLYGLLNASMTVSRLLGSCGVDRDSLDQWLSSEVRHGK